MNKIKNVLRLSLLELMQLVRSTKIIILAVFLIFINTQIVEPLRNLSLLMERKVSVFEPFVALGNSGVIVLILPLLFITMMADFPREGESQYFCRIRCSKRVWGVSQILYAIESSIALTLFSLISSVVLSLDFISWNMDYSYAVTRYTYVFPERAGDYVVQLIPENLYNQIPLLLAVLHTALLLIMYFFSLAMILLFFSLIKKKLIGILTDGVLIILGTITCAARMTYMWAFPMAHTITWLHYTEYQSKAVVPLLYSYLYFIVINILLTVLSIVISKRYNDV